MTLTASVRMFCVACGGSEVPAAMTWWAGEYRCPFCIPVGGRGHFETAEVAQVLGGGEVWPGLGRGPAPSGLEALDATAERCGCGAFLDAPYPRCSECSVRERT